VPVRTTRSRETYAGLAGEFKPNARMIYEMIVRPRWLPKTPKPLLDQNNILIE